MENKTTVFNDVYPELYLQQYRRTSGFKYNPYIETACDLVNCVNEIYIRTYIAITFQCSNPDRPMFCTKFRRRQREDPDSTNICTEIVKIPLALQISSDPANVLYKKTVGVTNGPDQCLYYNTVALKSSSGLDRCFEQ